MQKVLKRVTVILAIIAATLCLGVFASACDGNKDKDTYTVTVVYAENNTPVDGTASDLTVQICSAQLNGELITCYTTHKVGTDGKAEVKFFVLKNNTKYHLQLNNIPTGYEYHEDETFLTEAGPLTIKLYKV
ncbi:MAG: hypothetical protein NC489_41870 [Ruminococcus flavefaciens]|nr:hypothetical protein [Ruminococcus flavefaciens]